MKIVLLILAISSLLLAKNAFLPESTVAIVNGIAITEDELKREMNKLIPQSYYHQTINEEKKKIVTEKAMNSLIDNALLYGYALKKGYGASEADIEATLKKMELNIKNKVKDVKDTREYLKKGFEEIGISFNTLKLATKRDLTLGTLFEKEIKITFSEDELKDYYEKNKYKFKEPEKRRVFLIYIKNNPTIENWQKISEEKAKEAMDKIKAGENFSDIAAKYSDDMSRIKGGDLGFVHRGRLGEPVDSIAFALQKDEVSDIVKKDVGYYIVKVEETKESKLFLFEEIKESLLKDLTKNRQEERREALIAELKPKSKIIK